MGAVERIRQPSQDGTWSAAFANGFSEGQAARVRKESLSAYQRVGIDDYARGYRTGYYARPAITASIERTAQLQVVGL